MTAPIETIKLSQQAKEQLIKLKRWTGVMNWNVLCRWAFCISLAEPSIPPQAKIPADSSVEMSWKTFGGAYEEIFLALLRERCRRDGFELTPEVLVTQFRLHLHRGIGYLSADRRMRGGIASFFHRIAPTNESTVPLEE